MRNPIAAITLLLIGTVTTGAKAQDAGAIPFDRPESWALKYFVAATTFTPLGAPRTRRPGELVLGLEGGWIPHLSDSQRRVGFEGTALEDLNKTPVIGRVRALVGLPGGVTAEVGWIPPVELNGAKANLLDVALERPFVDTGAFAAGLRLWGQMGHVVGDITCPKDVASQPGGSPGNPLGCEEPSRDAALLNAVGAALTAGATLGPGSVHVAGGATYHDTEFQVGAETNDVYDATLLKTHGWTGWVAAGLDWPLGGPVGVGVEAFYSPLLVKRPPRQDSELDGFFNVRAVLRIALH